MLATLTLAARLPSAQRNAQSNHQWFGIPLRRYESSAKMQRLPFGDGDPVQRCQRRCAREVRRRQRGPFGRGAPVQCSVHVLLSKSRAEPPFRIRTRKASKSIFEEVFDGSAISKSSQKVSKSLEIVFLRKSQAKPSFRNRTLWVRNPLENCFLRKSQAKTTFSKSLVRALKF